MKLVEIFMNRQEIENSGGCCGGGGCNCSCSGDSYEMLSIEELVYRFSNKYKNIAEIDVHELSSKNAFYFMTKLNRVFVDNNESIVINEANMDFVLSKTLPIIIVDGKLIAINTYPDEEQLYKAIITGNKIPKSSSCC